MIIVKTKNGDVFVNEKATHVVQHDRENKWVVIRSHKEGPNCFVRDVEGIIYTNEAQPTEWKDEGSQVKDLQRLLADTKNELRWCYEMNKKIEDNLRSFASEMIQIVQYHHEQLPDNIRKQMRDHGEEMKAIANDEKWLYRRQWLEAHKVVEASEADVTDKLHKTIEDQAAEIRRLEGEIKRIKMERDMSHEVTAKKEKKPTLWQRLMKTKRY